MPFTPYIGPGDQALYGIADATAPQVAQATRLFNAYVGRPEGLLWSPDAAGAPACMTQLTPTLSFSGVAIPPGANVILTLPSGVFGNANVGDVAIIDRNQPSLTEACVVTAAAGSTITLANVQFTHPSATVDFGLTLLDEGSRRVRLSRSPVARIFCAFGRYGYGREMGRLDDPEALLVTNYGQNGVSGWGQLDTSLWDINYGTGSVAMPRHGHVAVRLRYVAGWPLASLPDSVKQCVANIARNLIDSEIPANVKTVKAGDATIEKFGPGLIDADTRAMAQPYKAMRI